MVAPRTPQTHAGRSGSDPGSDTGPGPRDLVSDSSDRQQQPATPTTRSRRAARVRDHDASPTPTRKRKRADLELPPLPGYLLDRRRRLNDAGGSLAVPNYDGLELAASVDEERPVLPDVVPVRAKEDVRLETGGAIPAPIAQYLRPYQIEGVAAMHTKFIRQEGLILGDDMGLGKTVQVAAFLAAAFGKSGHRADSKRMRAMRAADRWYPRVLIVCPGSLLANWQRELETWGWWTCGIYHGTDRADVLQTAAAGRLEIMVTTLRTYQLHADEINMVEWDCCVVDECHALKDASSDLSRTMRQLNALCRIGLTGTAIQNAYEDLWALLDWTSPGQLGTRRAWTERISRPLKAGQAHGATHAELALARSTADRLVRNLLPRFFLRRTKAVIAGQLPRKRDLVVFCRPTRLQQQAYVNYVAGSSSDHLLARCTTAIKLANHVGYLLPAASDSAAERETRRAALKTCLPDEAERLAARPLLVNYCDPELCGKWAVLHRLLRFWKTSGDKVLVFSYSTRLLRILDALLTSHGYAFCYLDGKTTYADRQREVDRFNTDSDAFVFLLSTKAGGLGLNIVAANRVAVWDPSWNPTHDLQAEDRAFRLGQRRDVDVYRLVTEGTIEEVVYARQVYKQQQANIAYSASKDRRYFEGVMGDADRRGELFGLENMLAYRESSLLREILNRTNIAEAVAADVGAPVTEIAGSADPVTDRTRDSDPHADLGADPVDPVADPITAIFSAAGVRYSHDNTDVLAPSAAELRLSAAAADKATAGRVFAPAAGRVRPPAAVRRRQLVSMAAAAGVDVVDFALRVERMTPAQRAAVLDRFYASCQ
ncbi:P-loop containing nucleoside triphosphate hydrolase protein [Dipodascopsis tothii]|uniref:P-loop containing nucleoside triphosphate hydrolase protein n=1 Tax=Dipodascopsis tothii TaxID=44089 RepID=UPI0034CD093E